ncbi:MAG: DegT/DnrJ/EryC1/StrS family aminotransferase, partial [Culicoidibacterales bacterium]
YEQAFKALPIEMMNIADFGESNYWLSAATLAVDSPVTPLQIMIELEKHNIESRPVWKPMHLQPVFESCEFFTANETGSISEDLFNRGICLPSDTKMTVEQQTRVIEIIKGMFV